MKKLIKRDKRIVEYSPEKITRAIYKASCSVGFKNISIAEKLSGIVDKTIWNKFKTTTPTVEDVQDIVEETLIKKGFSKIAKAYILYRQKRAEIREAKEYFGVSDELKLGINALKVLKKRYLLKDDEGKIEETPSQLFARVAKHIASAEKQFKTPKKEIKELEEKFFNMMRSFEFLPNSPTLMNAGTKIGQLSACFVLPVEDSIEGIFDAVKYMAIINKSGGGTGFSFSNLRPKGDIVKSTKGVASGPVSFMKVFDVATEVIKQGGRRRGANMGILSVGHPDILEFITAKSEEEEFSNFNLSVGITEKFMKALYEGKEFSLINPRTKKTVKKILAAEVFDLIVASAWRTGDPGIVFIDRINNSNPTPELGVIESTNPCGEQPLLPFESCNLGSINLSKIIYKKRIDWDKLKNLTELSVHFLDNVIDVNVYPASRIEEVTKSNRKIGLGVMGFAELLIGLDIPYNSEKATGIAEKIMKFITNIAREKSAELAKTKGSFPNFKGSIWKKKGYKKMRNATLTTIAPTGTISIIAGTSSGIEPLFAISFARNVLEGANLLEVNSLFEKVAKKKKFYSRELMVKMAKTGSSQKIKEVPKDIKNIFVTSFDVSPEWHVKIQAAFQKHTDNAVSKTVNLPKEATLGDIRKVFLLAHKLKCKGITVYRYSSKKEQVLYLGRDVSFPSSDEGHLSADSEYSGGCPASDCLY